MPGRVVTLKRFAGAASAGDTIGTANTAEGLGKKWRIVCVLTKYSAAPTYAAGVTVTLNSGLGAAYDTVLNTGVANAQNVAFIPSSELIIMPDDQIDVSAPAGGGVITSASAIYCEEVS
jgi:hypothetical protein